MCDPNEALRELRVIASRVRAEHRLVLDDVERAAELFNGLDGWLSRGGYLPTEWDRARPVWASACPSWAGAGTLSGLSGAEVGAE